MHPSVDPVVDYCQ